MMARRAVSWVGFMVIAAMFAPRLPLSWTGLIVAFLVAFIFAPRE